MTTEIKVPTLPESVTDATISKWYKKVGDQIQRDENLVDLETDKVMLEVPAPASGVIQKIIVTEGNTVKAGQLLAVISEEGKKTEESTEKKAAPEKEATETKGTPEKEDLLSDLSPSVRRTIAERGVDVAQIKGTGKGGRITKEDVEAFLAKPKEKEPAKPAAKIDMPAMGAREEKRVPMSRLRQRVAERLVQAQQEMAMLTTFNEVNMKPVMDLRERYRDDFEKAHGVRLGFMSFFTKATVEALKRFPAVNASVDGTDLIYHNYYDIGIAVGSPRGLVVPVVRNADALSMGEIEKHIKDYSARAVEGKLTIEEMSGGTFTITNGGVFGSLLSTPIVNPPQTAILGMHKISERAVVEHGQVVARPIMFIALTYDHRVIDGRESVLFLRTIKELIEDPARMLLEI